ncbi:hypothetical protein J41TS2_44690 [Bacillus sonorensis]|nr:hypothetical protein J41TS2_44690 [Bacillus sonorensis]
MRLFTNGTTYFKSTTIIVDIMSFPLNRHALRQVPWFINITAAVRCSVVCDQLQRDDGDERR